MRVAIYGRVSTSHQVDHQTIEQQLERLSAHQLTLPVAVAVCGALIRAFMAPGADQAIDLELHQPLERVGSDGAQKVAISAGLDLVEQKCHRVVGHHASLGLGLVLQLDLT